MNDNPQISAFEQQANIFIQNAAAMLVNGLRASIPQAPIPFLMVKLSSALGVAMGNVMSIGALGDILPMRKACIDAFSEGMRSVKTQPPPAPRELLADKPKLN